MLVLQHLCLATCVAAGTEQLVFSSNSSDDHAPSQPQKRVAVIGAGIAGAINSYYLSELSRDLVNIHIDIFESGARVGGRVKTVNAPQVPRIPVEVGGATYSSEDWCVQKAIKDAGLDSHPEVTKESIGVWNGTVLVVNQTRNSGQCPWWNTYGNVWRYGFSIWKFQKMVFRISKQFESFAAIAGFHSVIHELKSQGLTGPLLLSAEQYLQSQTISPIFIQEVIEPTVRLTSGRALRDLTGLEMALVMKNSNNLAVLGGNTRLIGRLLRLSGATLHMNDAVKSITWGERRKYRIITKHVESDHQAQEYDAVVITAPFQTSGIELGGLSLQSHRKLPPYVQNHITHVVMPERIASSFFNISSALPNDVLTTRSFDSSGFGILGIEHLGYPFHFEECSPNDDDICDEYHEDHWYKILSTQELPDSTIFDLMGKDSTTFAESQMRSHWIYRESWSHAFPRYQASNEFLDKFEIAPGLFYTAAATEIVGSLEMSARIGYNIAILLRNQFIRRS